MLMYDCENYVFMCVWLRVYDAMHVRTENWTKNYVWVWLCHSVIHSFVISENCELCCWPVMFVSVLLTCHSLISHLYSLLCCRSRNISIYDYLHVKIVIFTNIIWKRVICVKPCTRRVHSLNATRGLADRVPFRKTLIRSKWCFA